MIKKLTKIVFVTILSIGILFTSSIVHKYNFDKVKIEKKKVLTTTLTADETNTILFNKVKQLQQYAESYRTENSVSTSTTELCLQFIRKDRYNSDAWTTLLGEIDSNFVTYVTNKDSSLTFTNSDKLIDEKTMKEIDFIHMVATLNSYYKYGSTVALIISTDYAGWAGDLMTLLEEVVNYRIKNSITDTTIIAEYTNSLLGTNNKSTFSSQDAFADLDAININKISTISTDLYTTLVNYYINNDDTAANNSYNRFATVQATLGSESDIKTNASNLISSSVMQEMLIPDTKSNVTSSDTDILAQAFAEYVYQKGYITIKTTSTTAEIGTKVSVPLVEKHMDDATLVYDNSIATATISNSVLTITAINYGTTTINITAKNGTATANYNISVTNIAPSIDTDLTFDKELRVGTSAEISFTASGTNNIYTWYISDEENNKDSILATTTESKITIDPTLDMNNKYLNCGVTNEGNTEILTSAVQLKVTDPTITEDKDDSSDNTTDDETTSEKTYYFYEGENAEIDVTKDTYKVWIDADFSLFDKVYINDEVIDPSNYEISEGSIIIEFNKDYIKKLNNGTYSLKVAFTNGDFANTNFTIKNSTNNVANNTITTTNPITSTMFTYKEIIVGIIISGITILIANSKKKKHN